ncbi:MAG TPA: SDR family NAD(P)-dependent oxidoreductase [Frankiaceae bacterium]|jgi:3-oxoacyl-[acyl-carrier protein] reductase|nr:SDR family NAD(P)-dependent oxidoreductase [Frankiaceae bacterium]
MGRVAIVTGGASGIGEATAALLSAQGVAVAVFDIADGLRYQVDVSDADSVERSVTAVRRELGPIDVLVNAAGIPAGGPIDGDGFVDTWEKTVAVNLTGAMLMVRQCVADLRASGAGRIVNVASTEALTASRGSMPYTVSKHGLLGFTRSLAVELGRYGVTANCVCPGATVTGMTAQIPEANRDIFARRHIPLGRYARAEEIAFMVATLCAPQASFVNGAVIAVDGGMTAQSG